MVFQKKALSSYFREEKTRGKDQLQLKQIISCCSMMKKLTLKTSCLKWVPQDFFAFKCTEQQAE